MLNGMRLQLTEAEVSATSRKTCLLRLNCTLALTNPWWMTFSSSLVPLRRINVRQTPALCPRTPGAPHLDKLSIRARLPSFLAFMVICRNQLYILDSAKDGYHHTPLTKSCNDFICYRFREFGCLREPGDTSHQNVLN